MANSHATLTALFADIADAIRAKTGKTDKIVADNFPSEIEAIESGSSVDTCTLTIQSNLGYASLAVTALALNADRKIEAVYTEGSNYVDNYTVNNAICGSVCCIMDYSLRGIANASSGTEAINSFSGSFTFRITAPANGTASITVDP